MPAAHIRSVSLTMVNRELMGRIGEEWSAIEKGLQTSISITETKKSDIDLMIVMETDKRFFDRYDAFIEV
jgi:hypothetical protein